MLSYNKEAQMDYDAPDDLTTILAEIDRMEQSIRAGFDRLRGLVKPRKQKLDPRDPRNKLPNGKLTEQGITVCYRLFNEGKTPYTVGNEMDIAFGSAMHRFKNWQKIAVICLRAFVQGGARPGDVLGPQFWPGTVHMPGLIADFTIGLGYAVQQGWIEKSGDQYRLTEGGFAAAQSPN
jgi:hypothetical protein